MYIYIYWEGMTIQKQLCYFGVHQRVFSGFVPDSPVAKAKLRERGIKVVVWDMDWATTGSTLDEFQQWHGD